MRVAAPGFRQTRLDSPALLTHKPGIPVGPPRRAGFIVMTPRKGTLFAGGDNLHNAGRETAGATERGAREKE